MRAAAKALDARHGLTEPGQRTIDYAVYTAHGEEGCMAPNQYWVPGMFSPMPMMGKYFNYYGVDFLPPQELGRKCVERMVYEFYSENSGVCRFHRKWCEAIVDEIIASHYELPSGTTQQEVQEPQTAPQVTIGAANEKTDGKKSGFFGDLLKSSKGENKDQTKTNTTSEVKEGVNNLFNKFFKKE